MDIVKCMFLNNGVKGLAGGTPNDLCVHFTFKFSTILLIYADMYVVG